jgi:hypothetical protein
LKLVGALAVVDAVAVWEAMPVGEGVHVALTPDIATQLASDPENWRTFALPPGENAWVPQTDRSGEDEEMQWSARCREIANGNKPGRVLLKVTRGHATEELWLDVVAVTHQHWGNYAIDARFQESSVLNPLLRKGEMVRLSEYEIQRWEQ